jgi:hypothetical protein
MRGLIPAAGGRESSMSGSAFRCAPMLLTMEGSLLPAKLSGSWGASRHWRELMAEACRRKLTPFLCHWHLKTPWHCKH